MSLGPFDVPAERIETLGVRFTPFVNRLLELEVRAHQLYGDQLAVNSNETTPDGGVDAALRGSIRTDFLPAGESAWQFKRTGYGPKACADEFEKATWAHEFVRNGGSYIIVIAAALPDKLIENRRRAVAAKAIEIGVIATDDPERIKVYDANKLARWASRFPPLAISRLLGGPGSIAVDFDTWSAGRTHVTAWVADEQRLSSIEAIRSQVISGGIVEVRIQGESGIGKTRLVLEALRDPAISPLVAYVADERAVGGELLAHLVSEERVAILVVDECPAERHVKLVEQLPADPAIKLITIGDEGAAATRTPVIAVGAVNTDTSEEFLRLNYRQLSSEARRFAVDHSRGNMRWTIVLADRIIHVGDTQAADLIARDDIEQFVAALLPEGRDFFCSAALALFERIGWEGELRYQLELLANFVGTSIEEMESAAAQLERQGLLIHQGRYRSVTPHPLAVYLAAEAWRTYGQRLVTDLLPELDTGMALAFFGRVADLGRFEPARSVLPQLLSHDGPFGSLQQLESQGLGRILTQLAIVLPDEVALHLGELIEDASLEMLRQQPSSRRDIVWTLEKLVWHSRTFETAADALLRLARAENETYANNATGTWLGLFGTWLPGTAASPTMRVDYARRVAASADRDVRLLAVKAAARSLIPHETITVSGELQGGVLVEARGQPSTWGEAAEYRRIMISLLSNLANDDDTNVASSAADILIEAVHPIIGDPLSGHDLADAVAELHGDALQRLRASVEHLLSLYSRTNREDQINELLAALLRRLPPQTPSEDLQVLVQLRRWDFDEGKLEERIVETLRSFPDAAVRQRLMLEILREDVPAAWELGLAAASVEGLNTEMLAGLVDVFDITPSALIGYLSGLQASGNTTIFDDFLDRELAQNLSTRDRVSIAVRGPVTDRARTFIISSLRALPVADGIYAIFGWHRHMTEEEMADVLRNWTDRIESQQDYNAVVDWLTLALHQQNSMPLTLREDAWRLLTLRSEYPDIGQKRWAWGQLARTFVSNRCLHLSRLLLDLIDTGRLIVIENDTESTLLAECAQVCGAQLFPEVAKRVLDGSWRLQMTLRSWFLLHVTPDAVSSWTGNDVRRARVVASMAPVGEEQPTEITRFLLGKFGDDSKVTESLYGTLISGFWTGNESDRIAGLIERLNAWRRRRNEPPGVRRWARDVVESLERSRQAALQREAEEGF